MSPNGYYTGSAPHSMHHARRCQPSYLSSSNDKTWTTEIEPQGRWIDFRLRELWRYRDLVSLFVYRDFVARYKQTILGPLWYLIQPLFTTIVFTIVFGNIAGIPTDGVPKFLFYMAGSITWAYFAECLNKTHNTFTANATVFGKVYFPRLAIPLSVVISNLVTFGVQLLFFLLFFAYFRWKDAPIDPTPQLLLLPILVLMMAGMGLGLGLTVSAVTTRYRDLSHLVSFGVSLLMYGTPVVYPLSEVPETYRWLVMANPMTAVVETVRYAFLGSGTFDPWLLAYSVGVTIFVLLLGILVFHRVERTFMDMV